jgi:Thoeris protein ThsB, TIR-like domain
LRIRESAKPVLIGSGTANRPWINSEIKERWNNLKGIIGVYIHNLETQRGKQSSKGKNPFDYLTIGGQPMSNIVKVYDPPFQDSAEICNYIEEHLSSRVEDAIKIRSSTAADAAYASESVPYGIMPPGGGSLKEFLAWGLRR